ncbi:polysaccharide deacetylase family protein [uncultured Pseudokineococcus sp.]|uniref:polysaccharide deacetylase family protein n=1 Tax=uncultured Pseudokineococcus sp. TaxID=1642928 RepID=UPI002627142F|nr:polysaccharide deacetylase family protein [uncultured Pseudokineococcus sp.]
MRTSARSALTALLAGLVLAAPASVGAAGAHAASADPGVTATPEVVTTTGVAGRTIAITVDDGPDPRATPQLLEVLAENDARAVLCLWGDHVRQHPELVRQAVAGGHQLCGHTQTHPDLGTWSPMRASVEIRRGVRSIERAVPGAEVTWFRAPYGSWGASTDVAADLDLQPLGWQATIEDWVPPGSDVLLQRLKDATAPGAVVLVHDGGGDRTQTVEALAQWLPWLREQGYEVVLPVRPAERD